MIDWGSGYTCSWRLHRVDLDTWADADELGGVRQVTVTADTSQTAQKGSMTVDANVGGMLSGYYRLVMNAEQAGVRERVDVATLMLTSSGGTIEKGADALSIDCTSVLQAAADTRLALGSYAPKGADGPQYVSSLLGDALAAPVEYSGGFEVSEHHVFKAGTTVLQAAWKVLDAANYRLRVTGSGVVVVEPIPTEPSLELDLAHARMLLPSVRHSTPIGKVRNRYWAIRGREVAVAVNDDPESIVSHASRRTWSDAYDTSPVMTSGESLERYAHRRLLEQSIMATEYTYKREWWPELAPLDVVRGSIASVGLDGDMRVTAQKMTVGHGILVEETARSEVQLWQG